MGHHTLPPDKSAPAEARDVVRSQLTDDLNAEQLQDARLAISEIVSDAVQHGGLLADGAIDVEVQQFDGRVRVSVSGSGAFEMPEALPPPGEDRGYGLRIVDAVTDRWGVDAETGGVWFEFDLHAER